MSDEGFDDEVYARLAAMCTPVELLSGEEMLQSVVTGPVGVVSAGRLAVVVEVDSGRSRTIALLQEGDVLALPAGGWAGAPGARVRAATDSEMLVLSAPLTDVAVTDPVVGGWLLQALAAGVADRELSAAIALEPRLERRLILKLRQLAARWGKVTPEGVRLDLRVTHQELGDMVGGARESITVALGRLQDQGEVIMRRRTVILPRMDDHDRVATDTA